MSKQKIDLPVHRIRAYLEPGPIVLVSSADGKQRDIMTMGWHLVMEFSPALFGCVISSANHSFEIIRATRECVVNLPTSDLIDKVVAIGNTSGRDIDKFETFDLTAMKATRLKKAPLIDECYASFECRLHDDALVDKYNFFIFEVVKAHVSKTPKNPETLHYTGDGVFVLANKTISRRRAFLPGHLGNGR